MGKIYSTMAHALTRVFALCLLLVAGMSAAQAADTVEYGALELNKAYELKALNTSTGHYTATADGILTVTSSGTGNFIPYSDAACQAPISYTNIQESLPVFHYYYNLNVVAGQTVYFMYDGLNTVTSTLTFNTESSLERTTTVPEEGSTIMCTSTSQCSFGFSNQVSCSKVEIVAGSVSKPIEFNINSNRVFFSLKEPVYALMANGTLKEGDTFSVRLSGLCINGNESVKYGTDGVLTASFKCGAKPVALVSKSNFSTDHAFRSFWTKGDADGIVTLTFDGDIVVADGKVTLNYGDTSSGSEASARYTEVPPFSVEGNKLVIDLTDKERTPQTMLGITTVYDRMLLTVSSVCDKKGNPVYTASSGSRGTFTCSMPYSVETVNVQTQITPESGSRLGDTKQIEVYATDYKKFSFSGVRFAYTDTDGSTKVATVAKEACTETADTDIDGAYTLSVPVPAEVSGKQNVYMSLIDLKAADGKDYSALFSAKYNGFAVLDMTYQASAEAAPVSLKGASLGVFVADAPVVITTNYDSVTGNDSISYVTYDVFDLNAAEGDEAYVVTKTHIENHTDAGWEGQVVGAGNTKLYLGHTYRVVVTGYQQIGKNFNPYRDIVVGTDTLYFTGSEPDYVYSDITLDSFTPADSTISSADNFKLTLNYSGLVKIKQDETGIAGGQMREFIPFTAYEAVEPDNEGYSNQWVLSIDPTTAAGIEDRFVTINVVAEDQNGQRVRGNSGLRENTLRAIEFTLDYNGAELTVLPVQGVTEDLDSLYQFDVTAPDVIGLGSIDISEAHVFDMLNTVDVPVVSATYVYDDPEVQEIADYINNASYEEAVAKYGQEATDKAYFATSNTMRLTLEEPIKAEGGYTLVIPAGYFTSGEQFDGVVSKSYEGFFTVKGEDVPVEVNYTTDPVNGSTVTELGDVTIDFVDYETDGVGPGSGMITIKKNGEQIARVDALGDDVNWGKYTIPVNQTEKGIYTIEIPEGYFLDPEGNNIPAITLEYGIGMATGINNAKTDAKEAGATYTLSGVRVSGKLPAGLYIKGGKKVVVK